MISQVGTLATTAVSGPVAASGGAGTVICVSGYSFETVRELGRGSFGVVWEVLQKGTPSRPEADPFLAITSRVTKIALKWSTPDKREMTEACLLETEILKQLSKSLPKEIVTAERVPDYVVHGQLQSTVPGPMGIPGGGQSHVLLAMSKLEGQPLDQWLYGVDEQALKTMPINTILHGPLRNSRLASRGLLESSRTALEMLRQMAPVFQALEPLAVHRDLSAHNFLVRKDSESEPEQFSVLDFGLAVRTRNWYNEWQTRNIAGDPRYFAPAAWMLLTYGHKYIEAHPDLNFRRQYRDRIDHFAIGLLALEVFFCLWDSSEVADYDFNEDNAVVGQVSVDESSARRKLLEARNAWHGYWADAIGLYQHFHARGALAIRQALSKSLTLDQLVKHLKRLCLSLRDAAAAQKPEAGSVTVLLLTCADLVDWRSTTPRWQDLHCLISKAFTSDEEWSISRKNPSPKHNCNNSLNRSRKDSRADASAVLLSPPGANVNDTPCDSPTTPRSPERLMHRHRRVASSLDSLGIASPCRRQVQLAPKTEAQQQRATASTSAIPSVVAVASTLLTATAEHSPKEVDDANLSTPRTPPLGLSAIAEASQVDALVVSVLGAARPSARGNVLEPQPVQTRKWFSHRRRWTVDEAVSLGRGVPQVEVGNSSPGRAHENTPAENQTDDSPTRKLFGDIVEEAR